MLSADQEKIEVANKRLTTEWKKMKIGEIKQIDEYHQVMRVVGGWVFESINRIGDSQSETDFRVYPCFIPMCHTMVGQSY